MPLPRARSLSPTEARVVLSLEEQRAEDVSLDTIERLAGVSRGFARKLAHDLARDGWLQRVGRGRYLLNPSGYGPEVTPETDPLRVGSRLVQPYYFGFATAAELWGFLLQPGRTYFVVTTTRRTVRLDGPAHYRLVRVRPDRFFGLTTMRRRGQTLSVSDPERTVLDCLDRPELSGGMAGAVQVLARARRRLSVVRLERYVRRLRNQSLARRLGFLSERLGGPTLPRARGRRAPSVPSGGPWVPLGPPALYGRRGTRDPRWRVIVNLPERELLAEVDPP